MVFRSSKLHQFGIFLFHGAFFFGSWYVTLYEPTELVGKQVLAWVGLPFFFISTLRAFYRLFYKPDYIELSEAGFMFSGFDGLVIPWRDIELGPNAKRHSIQLADRHKYISRFPMTYRIQGYFENVFGYSGLYIFQFKFIGKMDDIWTAIYGYKEGLTDSEVEKLLSGPEKEIGHSTSTKKSGYGVRKGGKR